MTDRTEPSAGKLRELLAVVLEALDIPHPATVGDTEAHARILSDRAMHTVIALQRVLEEDGDVLGVEWTIAYLQERLAEHPPTGYGAWGDSERAAVDEQADDQDDAEQARRPVDAQFPEAARLVAEERTDEPAAQPTPAVTAGPSTEDLPPELQEPVREIVAELKLAPDPVAAAHVFVDFFNARLAGKADAR